jgi:hypothetical protein
MNVMKRAVVGMKLFATLLATVLVVSFAARAKAQIFQTEVRADDGTAYQIIHTQPTATGAEFIRITSLAGSSTGIGDCNNSQGMSGGLAQAIAGPAPPLQSLHPYFQILRTGVLTPPDLTFNFEPSFGGRVTLGTGPGALNICEHAFDCTGQSNVQSTFTLDSSMGSIPPACIANGVSAGPECDQSTVRNVFGFGVAASGSPPVCTNPTTDVTANSLICNPEPADGFNLSNGQFLVVIYDSTLAGLGFSVGSAGFGIDTDGDNPPKCSAGEIVSAQAASQSLPAPPLPSRTPSNTPTNTPTNTFTETPTRTPTNTSTPTLSPTPTSTVTNTVTPSNTPTLTATRTETPSPTATATQTPTRPPIPVVPSPTSPAGLAMIGGLSIGLLWALRRLARTGA